MTGQEIGVVDGWEDIAKEEFSSTVAVFEGGARCVVDMDAANSGDKVLIWQGVPKLVEDERGTEYEVSHFEGYEEVPKGAAYVLEIKTGSDMELTNSRFAQDIEEAKEIARDEVRKITDGEY